MTRSSLAQGVIVGVDTHKDVHVAVAIDVHGRRLGDRVVATTERGCVELHQWALGFAPPVQSIQATARCLDGAVMRPLAQYRATTSHHLIDSVHERQRGRR